ncbi:MAG: MBL fold metallo-hydrolase [Pseudomonadota bacterium]
MQVTPFQQNCSILKTPGGAAVVVDPGGEVDRIVAAAEAMQADIQKIWLTHGHLDHASGAMELKRRTGATIEGAHPAEDFWFSQIAEQSKRFGIEGEEGENVVPDRWLDDGDPVEIGDITFEVYFTPGHAPGHIIFHQKETRFAFTGDVLFKGSIGRTDFPMCDHEALITSITTKLWPLGDEVQFLPGHGPMSTFGAERQSNPFVSDAVLAGSAPSS